MSVYDFDAPVDRRGTGSLKWDVLPGELPLWVADMDFRTAPAVVDALRQRVEHGVFGYTTAPDSWRKAYGTWWRERHGWVIAPDELVFCTGAVPALSSIVRKLTSPGEKVLVQTPVYNIFFNSIVNNGRFVAENELALRDGVWQMDFDDLERKLADPQVSLMILCNPHNPVGALWDQPTLARVGELAWKYDVTVVSDEVHCDLVDPGFEYVPFASASPACAANSITLLAPSKAFNLAGLQSAAVVVPNAYLRRKVERGLNTDEVAEPNAFACVAAEAAFTQGGPWLDELRAYVAESKHLLRDFLEREVPDVRLTSSAATYLAWLDCRAFCDDSAALTRSLREQTGLVLCAGADYGAAGEGFLRMNLACSHTMLDDGLHRLSDFIQSLS